ncbi:hypothetical protein VCR4J2_40022 [Vibrio coralliirubri]|nr:hypothetical protein VCR4J2_40022 [Vibrio coralliirubri]
MQLWVITIYYTYGYSVYTIVLPRL